VHVVGKVRIYAFHGHLYACSSRYGRKVFLYKSASALGNYALSGQTVLAYVIRPNIGAAPPSTPTLVSRNLKTGAVLRQYLDNCGGPAAGGCGANTITRLVTNAQGSFTWIEYDEGPGSITVLSVNEDDTTGIRVLDEEVGGAPCIEAPPSGSPCQEMIDPGYLIAAGGMVFWRGGPNETLQSASFN
jgi:hypothetical protein